MEAKQEDMLVHELDEGLLREVEGSERSAIDETYHTVNRLVFVLCLIRDVLAREEVYLNRIELLSQELTEERLIRLDLEGQVMQLHQL